MGVLVSSKSVFKKYLYGEFDDKYPKKPSQSLKKTPMIIFIRAFISAYDSTAQDLAAKIHQKWPLFDQDENSMIQRFFDRTIEP